MPPESANEVLVGSSSSDHVKIRVLGRSHSGTSDYWDGNWLNCEVSVASGQFHGRFIANLRSDEFHRFRARLTELYRTLSGKAELAPIEQQIEMTLSGDGKGHVAVAGVAVDRVGTGNRLTFSFAIDQTYLPLVISSLEAILAAFPVVGSSDA